MKASIHVITTVPVSALSYGMTTSWKCAIGVLIVGILIDIDHVLEFWHDNRLSFDVQKFFKYGNSGVNTRQYVVFHSYEIIPFLFIGIQFSIYPFFCWGMLIGLILHLFLDYINIVYKLNYRWYSFVIFSIFFRMVFKFRRDEIDQILQHRNLSPDNSR